MDISLPHPSRSTRRLAYAAAAAGVLTAIVVVIATQDTGYWQLAVFGLGPDVALLAGVGGGLAKGQLHPRAVPLYNALHRFWGPLALLVLVALAGLPAGYLVGGLAWTFHIALDRAVGYGLRTRDGFQRG